MNLKKMLAAALAVAVSINITVFADVAYGAAQSSAKPAVAAMKPEAKPIGGTELKNIRIGGDGNQTRIVMDLSSAKKYNYGITKMEL